MMSARKILTPGCLVLAIAAGTMLSACSAPRAPMPASRSATQTEAVEPLPPGIKPLTLEQEEAVDGQTK